MLDLVGELTTESGATILMVTHDPADAARLADQIVLVADAKAHPPQEAKTMLADPPPALKAYLGHK
jgi:thiamine transport system ATP-binding protein